MALPYLACRTVKEDRVVHAKALRHGLDRVALDLFPAESGRRLQQEGTQHEHRPDEQQRQIEAQAEADEVERQRDVGACGIRAVGQGF